MSLREPREGEFGQDTASLLKVLHRAYRRPFTLQSNYARKHADYVGVAASMGLISTRVWGQVFSAEWRVTLKGLGYLSVHLGEEFASSIEMVWGHDSD